ncbi:MAG: PAS domain-containing protein, partial [Desulfobacterales bacterium]|nr:PAS domain-containing protein [Desulfobacterales bacterium]
MEDKQYKYLIQTAPFGFAYHKIILNSDGKPINYQFIEVNNAFEKLTGLKASNILNRTVTEAIPGIVNDDFDWIAFYGDIALNNSEKEFEQYSEHLKRWYKVQVYSPEKYYFSTIFIDISKEKKKTDELKRSENMLKREIEKRRILLDNIHTQVWYLIDDHTYGLVNKAHAEFNGSSVKDMAFKDMYDIFPKNVVEVCRQGNMDVINTGNPIRSEEWLPNVSGEQRLFSILKSP